MEGAANAAARTVEVRRRKSRRLTGGEAFIITFGATVRTAVYLGDRGLSSATVWEFCLDGYRLRLLPWPDPRLLPSVGSRRQFKIVW